jgi:predicted ester cyclase
MAGHFTRRTVLAGLSAASAGACATKGESMTREERNLAAILENNAAFNRGDVDAMLAIRGAGPMINHGIAREQAQMRMIMEDIRARAPDARLTIQESVAGGDHVVCRMIYSGTHLGMGKLPVDSGQLIGVPPTGRHFAVQHIHWYIRPDDAPAEHYACRDDLSMLIQLGVAQPRPGQIVRPAAPDETPVAHHNVTGTAEQTRNLAAIEAQHAAMMARDLDASVNAFAPDARNFGRVVGRDGIRGLFEDIFRIFTSVRQDVKAILAVDDCVIVRLIGVNVHSGQSQGRAAGGCLGGALATNREFARQEIHWYTLRDGLIVEHRACRDDVSMLVQLGLMPPAPPPLLPWVPAPAPR